MALCASNLYAQEFVQISYFKNTPETNGEININKSILKVEGNHTGNPSGLYLVRYTVNGVVNVKKVIIP